MKKKQIAGIIVAGLVFTFVCSMSVLTNHLANKAFPKEDFLDAFIEESKSFDLPMEDFIGVVKVDGTIMNSTTSSLFSEAMYDHENTLDLIDALIDSDSNKGLLLCVNSPGGGIYESDELYLKLQEYKDKTKRPIWTYMKTEACSGGYYISMASDHIAANRNTWTGSIGVIISLSNYKDLMDKIGVKSVYITSGKNKAMGASGAEMTEEQRNILQSLVDEAYDQFVTIVADGRDMTPEKIRPIADGRIYSAKQALKLNLIDEIDTYDNVVKKFKKEVGGDVTIYTPSDDIYSLSSLFGMIKGVTPKSDAEIMTEFLKSEGNGVPMYYANPEQY